MRRGNTTDGLSVKCLDCLPSHTSDQTVSDGSKECSRCLRKLPVAMFSVSNAAKSGLLGHCKECARIERAHTARRRPEARRLYKKRHRDKNKHRPEYRLSINLRVRLSNAVRRRLAGRDISAVRDLGCTVPELMTYLEQLFTPGMSWETYGEWHIDHIVPICAHDLTNRDEMLKAVHYTNLQPLWAADNYKKIKSDMAQRPTIKAEDPP